MRILSSEVREHIGEAVHVEGWLHKKRLLGGLTFINVRDRRGLTQVVLQDKDEVEKLRGLQIGTVLAVEGTVKEEPRAPGGAELHDAKITVLVPVTDEPPIEIDKPLSHKPENLDTLFDNRVIGLRNLQEQTIFKVQAKVLEAAREYFIQNGFTEMNTPKLLAGATEGGAEVFKLDYFGKEATLAQSAQFYKQMMVGVFERVFETNPTYRAEPSATTRHMTEYITIDAEMGFIEFDDLLTFTSGLINHVADRVWEAYGDELKKWNVEKPVLTPNFPRLTMAEVHALYAKANKDDYSAEDDLRPDEERWICEYAKKELGSEAVFVTDWPASSMKFYHRKKADNPELADRSDLLFRGVEIATAPMREHRYEVLVQQLKDLAHGDPEHPGFKPYLSAFKYGLPPHGGFGMGLERLTEKLLNLGNVKEATLFPRDINRLGP
ncbi:MAG TPA: aspartate--tRNA(Asn) ligase [Candidatus Saccharimonadales bacterium]|nr:aspartate--tRNA(Asn) ligase [Candidatus Saccharimonadales bacterium]